MKTFIMLSIASVVMCFSCGTHNNNDAIKVEYDGSVENFASLIESVEYIPLETDSVHILGGWSLLVVDSARFVVCDKEHGRIYSYDTNGSFIEQIGNKGNASGEFLNIVALQSSKEGLVVFSYPDKEITYMREGGFKEKSLLPFGTSVFRILEDYLYYYGYGTVLPYRLSFVQDGVEDKFFLYSDVNSKVLGEDRIVPFFSRYGDDVFLVDSYNPSVLIFRDKMLSEYCRFDLGKYSMPEKYFKFASPYEALSYLQEQDVAIINSFNKSAFYDIVEICRSTVHYGIRKNNQWHWCSVGEAYKYPFAGTFHALVGDCMYFLIPPRLLVDMPSEIASLAINPESIANLKEDDNYVITKIKLK